MTQPTLIPGDHSHFFDSARNATSRRAVRELLASLPIVSDEEYTYNEDQPAAGWKEGSFHWVPVNRERGNQGRIKLAGAPENPIAERTINGMEAIIELQRQRELKENPKAAAPENPRAAVLRYFDLPPLDLLPKLTDPIRGKSPFDYAKDDLAPKLRVKLLREKTPVGYTVLIEDDGIGQGPSRMHTSLLSLGKSDKADKPYLIGVFGQGGSSAYAVSEYSWIMSRRAPECDDDGGREMGWTVVRQISPKGRRDPYFAYLAAHHDGRVPRLSAKGAEAMGYRHGTRFAHIGYNFGKAEPTRTLFQALNHLLFNPVLPFEIYTKGVDGSRDLMWGTAYRLSKLTTDKKALDKPFGAQLVEKKLEAE
jgi:hypothetical protein